MADIQLVVVTPETTLIDEAVNGVRFPLFDGSMGVLPGHAPLVGRVGCGELSMTTSGETRNYFVDGGFVQINGRVVTLLTERCLAAGDIDRDAVQADLDAALAKPAASDTEIDSRQREQDRARAMLALKQ